jgi:hypothetical protein
VGAHCLGKSQEHSTTKPLMYRAARPCTPEKFSYGSVL